MELKNKYAIKFKQNHVTFNLRNLSIKASQKVVRNFRQKYSKIIVSLNVLTSALFCRRSLWHKAKKCHLTPGQTELKVRMFCFIVCVHFPPLVIFSCIPFRFEGADVLFYFQVDFPLPIVACNLMIEYADFYENFQVRVTEA